jgi:hypothetical protein
MDGTIASPVVSFALDLQTIRSVTPQRSLPPAQWPLIESTDRPGQTGGEILAGLVSSGSDGPACPEVQV